jgi:NitT/TauT family transport system permease protein
VPTLLALSSLACTERFLLAALGSTIRVAAGLAIAVPIAALVGIASGLDARVRAFVRPLFSVVAATPVLSVILIALLWFGQERTPVFTAFLMVFPVMAANATEGVRAADSRLLEAARVYDLSRRARLRHLYLPTLAPYLLAGARSSLSLCWKVVVAAEVIAQPTRSLGAGMQAAKAMLETTELFAWTAATVLLAGLTELALFTLRKRGLHGARR